MDLGAKAEAVKTLFRQAGVQEKLYTCVANVASLLTSYIRQKGKTGWSGALVDSNGEPMLSSEEQERIESTIASAPWIGELLLKDGMHGGGTLFEPSEASKAFTLTGDDISLDRTFHAFIKKTKEIDDYWDRFGRESGFIKKIYEREIPLRVGQGPPLILKSKSLVVLLMALVDSLRVSLALSPMDTKLNRTLLTLLVGMEELATGQWRQFILTSLGFISPSGVAAGVVLKYLVNAWVLLNPELRSEIVLLGYKASKSLVIGAFLWAATVLPPVFIQEQTEEGLKQLRELVAPLQEQIDTVKESANKVLEPQGLQVSVKGVGAEGLANITVDDIQVLQTLAQNPALVCSKEACAIIERVGKDPLFRLVLELCGVPTTKEDRFEVCGEDACSKSVSELATESLTPTVIGSPAQGLGQLQGAVQGAQGAVQSVAQGAQGAVQSVAQSAVQEAQSTARALNPIGGAIRIKRRRTKSTKRRGRSTRRMPVKGLLCRPK